jgi:Ser/Thr protein kinase RdoA (MazF antagonist)
MSDPKVPATDLFFSLTPDAVLDAVEFAGVRCAPVCVALNSFENRVYDITLDDGSRLISKFYRPERWTREQILEEHQFLADCAVAEIPVCPVRPFPDGSTLRAVPGTNDTMFYCLFERRGGRAPEELSDELVERLGMLTARLHNVGVGREARHRIRIGPDALIRDNIRWLLAHDTIPDGYRQTYVTAAHDIADMMDTALRGVAVHRVHGDLHLGNLVQRGDGLNLLDFDDFGVGPAVQDMWLVLPGRDIASFRQREVFLEGYEQFRTFDRATLRLVEGLRAMRWVHYSAWLARRWHDPTFPATWPHFGTDSYWASETRDLVTQRDLVERELFGERPPSAEPAAEELTNKDFFWDWEA